MLFLCALLPPADYQCSKCDTINVYRKFTELELKADFVGSLQLQGLLLGLLAEEFLGLWVMDQDLRQVLLIQDEEVGESVRLHVGCTTVSSTSRKQTDQSEKKRKHTFKC